MFFCTFPFSLLFHPLGQGQGPVSSGASGDKGSPTWDCSSSHARTLGISVWLPTSASVYTMPL